MTEAAFNIPLVNSPYIIETGYVSLNKHGEELCGDNVVISHRNDSVIMVLSDGLGSGVKANILSTLTTKIAGTMLEMGARLDEVVETVGQTLPVCQVRGLAYSTFTIIQIFNDGKVYMAEFDNPSVFYIHRGKVTKLPHRERRIGANKVKETRFMASEGDFLVAISDGVVHAGIGGVLNLGWQWPNVAKFLEKAIVKENGALDIAHRLGDICRHLYAGRPGDDTTVAALYIRRPRHLTIVVGPPRKREDDAQLAHLLAEAPGRRVVCGGTTSNIIAREWKTDLDVDLRYCTPTIPPLGRINGVDLVTEGIITVSSALEKLKGLNAGMEMGQVLMGEDGASMLAALLWESDQIDFLVGGAINPAHQNPELPLGLALKEQVIQELTHSLKQAGKTVTVTSF
ncbi:MAG: SpoIIE family protein phosphatase [Firmicutes bacterium]|nr:SpoIIE family protein phosphatase [Bacillota bacterium]